MGLLALKGKGVFQGRLRVRRTGHLQAMADQGSGGAFEISQRMTAMLGWGATASFKEDWTWNQAAETYALDPEMAAKLRKSNPQVPQLLSWWSHAPWMSAPRNTPAKGVGAAGFWQPVAPDAGGFWQGHVECRPGDAEQAQGHVRRAG